MSYRLWSGILKAAGRHDQSLMQTAGFSSGFTPKRYPNTVQIAGVEDALSGKKKKKNRAPNLDPMKVDRLVYFLLFKTQKSNNAHVQTKIFF